MTSTRKEVRENDFQYNDNLRSTLTRVAKNHGETIWSAYVREQVGGQ